MRRGRTRGAFRRASLALALALALAALTAPVAAAAGAGAPRAVRLLVERLERHGRAEATLVRLAPGRPDGAPKPVEGHIVLERPDRVKLSFPATGEVVTLRRDGGEWLQPKLEQMVTFDSAQAAVALRWWGLVVTGGGGRFGERRIGERRFALWLSGEGGAGDSAVVELGADGLPATLEVDEGAGTPTLYRLSQWRFRRPKGRADFVLHAPRGYRVVALP